MMLESEPFDLGMGDRDHPAGYCNPDPPLSHSPPRGYLKSKHVCPSQSNTEAGVLFAKIPPGKHTDCSVVMS
jgi:hypothetical protein